MPEPTGPVEFLALTFPLSAPGEAVEQAVRSIAGSGNLAVVDVMVGARDQDGAIEFTEYFDAREGLGLADLDLALRALVSDDDLEAVAGRVGPGERVVVLVIEHAWHRDLTEVARAAGGRIVLDEWVDPDVFVTALTHGSAQVEGA